MPPSTALSYRWFLNEFPNFLKRSDGRWFVSQATGNLYVAKAEANDTGSYFCFTTISMDISTKSTFSRANQLTVLPNGREALEESLHIPPTDEPPINGNVNTSAFEKFNSALVFVLFFPANPRKSAPNIKVRFPAETYALAGHTAQLECFAYGKYVSPFEII